MATSNLIEATSNHPQVLVAGLVEDSVQEVYEVSANTSVAIATATLCNSSMSSRTVTISVVEAGGSISTSNRVAIITLAASESCIVEELMGLLLGPGDIIAVGATALNAVSVVLTGAVSS